MASHKNNKPALDISMEPLVSLFLIGLLLIGMVLYYRTTQMQRFLEPALAALEPRISFSANLRRHLVAEFGPEAKGIKLEGNAIRVSADVLMQGDGEAHVLRHLGRVFAALLSEQASRERINLILVKGKSIQGLDTGSNHNLRKARQADMDEVLDRLFRATPALEKTYPSYFAATTLSGYLIAAETQWVDFEIVPSERVHAEVLQVLGKYGPKEVDK